MISSEENDEQREGTFERGRMDTLNPPPTEWRLKRSWSRFGQGSEAVFMYNVDVTECRAFFEACTKRKRSGGCGCLFYGGFAFSVLFFMSYWVLLGLVLRDNLNDAYYLSSLEEFCNTTCVLSGCSLSEDCSSLIDCSSNDWYPFYESFRLENDGERLFSCASTLDYIDVKTPSGMTMSNPFDAFGIAWLMLFNAIGLLIFISAISCDCGLVPGRGMPPGLKGTGMSISRIDGYCSFWQSYVPWVVSETEIYGIKTFNRARIRNISHIQVGSDQTFAVPTIIVHKLCKGMMQLTVTILVLQSLAAFMVFIQLHDLWLYRAGSDWFKDTQITIRYKVLGKVEFRASLYGLQQPEQFVDHVKSQMVSESAHRTTECQTSLYVSQV